MRIKSFFSDSTDLAIEMARRELGEEALILNSRSSPPEARHLGAFEVVFAAPEDAPPLPRSENRRNTASDDQARFPGQTVATNPTRSHPAQTNAARAGDPPFREVGITQADLDLQQQIERLRKDLEGVFRNLTAQGALSKDEAAQAQALAGPATKGRGTPTQNDLLGPNTWTGTRLAEIPPPLQSELTQLLSKPLRGSELDFPATSGRGAALKRIAFTGPAGAGKTSMAVNTALQLGLYQKKSVAVIGVDGERVAANEPLRTYCAIAGLPFYPAASASAISRLLQEHAAKDLLVVDCPAYSLKYESEGRAIAGILQQSNDVVVHLVLSACYNFSDLREMLKHYAVYSPGAIAATRWDESRCVLPLLAACLEARLPIRWANSGQSIPDDFILKPLAWIEEKYGPRSAALHAEFQRSPAEAKPDLGSMIAPALTRNASGASPGTARLTAERAPENLTPLAYAKAAQALEDVQSPRPNIALGPVLSASSKNPSSQVPLNARLPFTAGESSPGDATSQQLIEEILRRFRPNGKSAEALAPRPEQENVAA